MSEKEEQSQSQQDPDNHEQPTDGHITQTSVIYAAKIEPPTDNQDRYTEERFHQKSQRNIGVSLNWITAIGAVFLLATLYYTRRQFQVDQRPYIVVESRSPSTMRVYLPPGKIIDPGWVNMQWNIEIRDIGKTPAVNVVYETSAIPYLHDPSPIGKLEDAKRIDSSFKDLENDLKSYGFQPFPEDRRMDFAPNDGITILGVKNISSAESNGLTDATYSMDVVGIIKYMDSFGTEHETQFCFMYRKQPGFGEWHPCFVHNTIK